VVSYRIKIASALFVLLALYAGGYMAFRHARAETWARDGRLYVVFPNGPGRALYYLWQPLSYVDGVVTGVGSRVGWPRLEIAAVNKA